MEENESPTGSKNEGGLVIDDTDAKNAEGGKPRLLYSMRLERYVSKGHCLRCGEKGHYHKSHLCPLRQLDTKGAGKDKRRYDLETGKRNVITPQQRASRFVSWLLSKIDLEELQEGHVLDVAGGIGKVACELQLRNGVETTIVDPRKMVLSKNQQMRLDAGTSKPLPKQICKLFKDDFLETEEHQELWEKVFGDYTFITLVVGMHPDEATERIVRFALDHDKSFAVIPCCVFKKSFPNRRMPDGTPVQQYPDFCKYLAGLHPDIQSSTLDMPGRNIVIYRFL